MSKESESYLKRETRQTKNARIEINEAFKRETFIQKLTRDYFIKYSFQNKQQNLRTKVAG